MQGIHITSFYIGFLLQIILMIIYLWIKMYFVKREAIKGSKAAGLRVDRCKVKGELFHVHVECEGGFINEEHT